MLLLLILLSPKIPCNIHCLVVDCLSMSEVACLHMKIPLLKCVEYDKLLPWTSLSIWESLLLHSNNSYPVLKGMEHEPLKVSAVPMSNMYRTQILVQHLLIRIVHCEAASNFKYPEPYPLYKFFQITCWCHVLFQNIIEIACWAV